MVTANLHRATFAKFSFFPTKLLLNSLMRSFSEQLIAKQSIKIRIFMLLSKYVSLLQFEYEHYNMYYIYVLHVYVHMF